MNDTNLIPNTPYFYKVRATDSSSPVVTGDSSQLAVTTTLTTLSQNSFNLVTVVGQVDMPYNTGTFGAVIDSTQGATLLSQGTAVKIVASTSGGAPHVIACTASNDNCWGFINFNLKNINWGAGQAVDVSTSGNVIWLYTTAAITQGAQVCLDVTSPGAVKATGGSATVVGYALDGAAASGSLIRVHLKTPSFATA